MDLYRSLVSTQLLYFFFSLCVYIVTHWMSVVNVQTCLLQLSKVICSYHLYYSVIPTWSSELLLGWIFLEKWLFPPVKLGRSGETLGRSDTYCNTHIMWHIYIFGMCCFNCLYIYMYLYDLCQLWLLLNKTTCIIDYYMYLLIRCGEINHNN